MVRAVGRDGIGIAVSVAGALILLSTSGFAQSEQAGATPPAEPAQAASKTESSVSLDTSAKIELAPKPEQQLPSAATVDAFIVRLDRAMRAVYEDFKKDPALVRDGCRNLLNDVLDLDSMTRATNVDIWNQMSPPQREVLRAAFEQRMIAGCIRQFGQYDGEDMHLAGVKPTSGGDMLATVRLGTPNEGKLVTWRLQRDGSKVLRAVDIITEGRSAVSDARNEFAAVLQSTNGDIEALIAFMQK